MIRHIVWVAALMVPVVAGASDVGRTYVTPQAGVLRADRDRPVDEWNWLGGITFGHHFSEAISGEVTLNGTALDSEVAGIPNLSVYGGSLDLLFVFGREHAFAPYLGIGAGALENQFTPGSDDQHAMGQVSVGAFWRLWESGSKSLALRPDFKARWDDAHSSGRLLDYIGTLGLQFSFGSEPPPPPPPPPPAAAAPLPSPPPAVPQAPPDSDGDGVTDDRDRCPGTPAGVAVDADGCPQKGSITLEGVTFDYNSAQLTPTSLYVLDEVAEGLKKHPRLRVELQGHTDSKGSAAYNLALSERRANAVHDYLIKENVPSAQITAKGYGEAQPIADNATEAGRARNRRVVMFVLDNPGDVKVEGEGAVKQ
jgi:OOP family OmpA-OmpF porin